MSAECRAEAWAWEAGQQSEFWDCSDERWENCSAHDALYEAHDAISEDPVDIAYLRALMSRLDAACEGNEICYRCEREAADMMKTLRKLTE